MKLLDAPDNEPTSNPAGLAAPSEGGSEGGAGNGDAATRHGLAAQAAMILSAMDAAGEGRDLIPAACDRREEQTVRVRCRVRATLKLFADPEVAEPWTLFLRDLEPRAAGFICPDRMPLGYGGTLTFDGPDGQPLSVDVTLVRCRICYGGWYEGALYFHHNQPELFLHAGAA